MLTIDRRPLTIVILHRPWSIVIVIVNLLQLRIKTKQAAFDRAMAAVFMNNPLI
jgi:hypothetical protein